MKYSYSFIFLGLLGLSLGTGVVQGSDPTPEADVSGRESVQMLYEGYPVKFACNFTDSDDADGAGTPTPDGQNAIRLNWFKDGVELIEDDRMKIFQENNSLVILSAERDDVGNYSCQTDTGKHMLTKTITLIFLEIRKMDKSLNVDEKESFTVTCPADGSPAPVIIWKRDQKLVSELMTNDSRISLGPNDSGIANGTLTINPAEYSDRGNYTCIVTSLLMSYEKWTFVRVKDIYAALWPFIGIVIEAVVLAIIIIIFERRRAKAEFDESDTDQGNDQKNKGKDRRRK